MPSYQLPFLRTPYPYTSSFSERDNKPRVHINIQTEKRDRVSERNRRDLATEFTKTITVPNQAEDNLGVVHQKRVEEDYENAGKRDKILKLDKRDLFEPMFWEPRATIRGNKVVKNPILQLLRAAAGQKTQRILGLNSKAFDIFPGPLPEEQNMALNNNLGKVTNGDEPVGQYQGSVDQQIMRSFRRQPYRRNRYASTAQYQQTQSMTAMYPQENMQPEQPQYVPEYQTPVRSYTPQRVRYPVFQQRRYVPAPLQQTEAMPIQQEVIPQQEMAPTKYEPQEILQSLPRFSSFSPFVTRRQDVLQQQPQQSFIQQPDEQNRFTIPQASEMFERPQFAMPLEGMPMQEQALPVRTSAYQMDPGQRFLKPEAMQDVPAQTRDRMQYPQYSSQEAASSTSRSLPIFGGPGGAQSLPEMKYSEPEAMLTEAPEVRSKTIDKFVQKSISMNPLEESQNIMSGHVPEVSSVPLAKAYRLSPENMAHSERRYLSETSWLNGLQGGNLGAMLPTFSRPRPMYMPIQRHAIVSNLFPHRPAHIPHPVNDDDDFDEKPEVHVHIQTEKSHISKPNNNETKTSKSLKKT